MAGDTFIPDINLRHSAAFRKPRFIYKAYGSFTKKKERIIKKRIFKICLLKQATQIMILA